MTRDDIIRMAEESGLNHMPGCEGCCWQSDVRERPAIMGEEDGN